MSIRAHCWALLRAWWYFHEQYYRGNENVMADITVSIRIDSAEYNSEHSSKQEQWAKK